MKVKETSIIVRNKKGEALGAFKFTGEGAYELWKKRAAGEPIDLHVTYNDGSHKLIHVDPDGTTWVKDDDGI